MDIQGKVVVVTGGASGLGLAAAKAFHNKGAQVNLFDLNEEAGLSVTQEIGNGCAFFQVNVTDESSVQQAIDDIVAKQGAIHVVLNCAGIGPPEKAIDRDGHVLPLEKFKRIIDINLVGSFNVLSKAVGYMAKQAAVTEDGGRGVNINVASVAGRIARGGDSHYGPTKAYVIALSEALALTVKDKGVNVSALCPGFTHTDFHETAGLNEMKRSSPSFLWYDAETVVREGLRGVDKGKPIVVSGRLYRWLDPLMQSVWTRWIFKTQDSPSASEG